MNCDYLSGFTPLIDRYDGFLLDQWGVLHDGVRVYSGVLDVLEAIRAAGKPTVLLSNSGKRAFSNEQKLTGLGVRRELYRAVVSSGEIAWRGLQRRDDPLFADLGRRCCFIARDGDRSAVDGLDLELCGAADADFVLLAGTDSDAGATRRVEDELAVAGRRGLPVVCSNPDFSSVEPGSGAGKTPGTLARDHENNGFEVRWVGKPWPAVYRAALAELSVPAARTLMVGDSLHHDVKGAHGFDIDGALLTHGVHDEHFGDAGGDAALTALAELAGADAPAPRWLLRRLAP